MGGVRDIPLVTHKAGAQLMAVPYSVIVTGMMEKEGT